jgi:DAK2 domain fusion protein YloV
MTDSISAEALREALARGAEHLGRNQRLLDNLNVFPVPDGDTGTNMVATLQAGVRALGDGPVSSMAEVSSLMREELLRNSRGNSGFIVAWFFNGFLGATEHHEHLTGDGLIEGFAHGSYQARASLFSPVEGTMITIIAAMSGALGRCAGMDPLSCLRHALAAGRESLFETPRMLPLLAKAGVVDAGALGFILIVEGMLSGLTNEAFPPELEAAYRFRPDPRALLDWAPLPDYRYCTEVFIDKPAGVDDPSLRAFLEARGNSIALVVDPRFIKLHIHTDDPDSILQRLGGYGTITSSKVEDMREQVAATAARPDEVEESAILACVPGDGFEEVFKELGVTHCLRYGRELPTAGAILDVISEIEAPSIIILPANGNIIPAATVARDLCGRDAVVVATRNVVEGIAASYGYSENDTLEENARNMKDCVGLATSLSVYRSASSSVFGEQEIPEGAYFAMQGDTVLSVGDDAAGTVLEALSAAGAAEKCDLTLYTGETFDESVLPAIEEGVRTLNPSLRMETRRGGQPRELLIISLE